MSRIKLGLLLACTLFPSWARLLVWRSLGFRVGRGCRVSMLSVVVANRIELGDGAIIEPLTLIYRPDEFIMGERARIAGFNRIVGYRGTFSMAPQSFIALGCLIDVTGDVHLGARSAIGPRSTLYSHGATGMIFNVRYPHRIGPIRIGADCWLGMGCLVQPQLTIGDRVLVLPGMVVRRDIPAGMAAIAGPNEYELIPVGRLLLGVTDEVLQGKMDELLCGFASRHDGSHLDQATPGARSLRLKNGDTILLLCDASHGIEKDGTATSVIWTLRELPEGTRVPVFCFERLTMYGEPTAFSDRVADELCLHAGVHFVYDAPSS